MLRAFFTGLSVVLMLVSCVQASAEKLYLYKVEQRTGDEAGNADFLQVTDYQELKDGGNSVFASSKSLSLEAGSMWVVSTVYPRLYNNAPDGGYDYSVAPAVENLVAGTVDVFTDAERKAGQTSVVYRVPEATAGTLIFKNAGETADFSLAAPVFFKVITRTGTPGLYNYTTAESNEMYTLNGETYLLDRVYLYSGDFINISGEGDFTSGHSTKEVKISNGVSVNIPATSVGVTQAQMVGSVSAIPSGNSFTTLLTPVDPAPFFLAIVNNSSLTKPESFLEFEVNEDRDEYDYDYVVNIPSLTGGSNSDKAFAVVANMPVIGSTLHVSSSQVNISSSDYAVDNKEECPGTELTFDFKTDFGHRYVFADGTFNGRLYVSAKKNADGSVVENQWVGKAVVSRSAQEIMEEFASNNELLDNEVNGRYPLRYSYKPIMHDNPGYKDVTGINVPNPGNDEATEHELIFLDNRRALTGVDCNINHVAGGSLASVVNVQTNLGNMMSSDLNSAAEFVGVVNVKLATAPLVSVRDEKHYFARGTEAGFNLASGTGTKVLSLSVVEALSLAFYRDGQLMTIVPAASKSGKGVDLSVVSINSDNGSYDLKAVSPVVFDEVCLFNSGGLKLELGDALKVNYAFVGSEGNSEITLGSKGRAAFNEQKKAEGIDYELYILSHSTPAHIAGGVVNAETTNGGNFVGDEDASENLTNVLSLGTLGMGWAEVKLDAVGADAPADYEQIFPAGSRVNFKLSSTKVLNLGLGTGNTITFYSRKNVVRNDDGSIKSIGWDATKQVLTATVLQLGVISVDGAQMVSMVAPCDFSGLRLDINDGLVNLGATNVYYASITPAVTVPHKCEIGIPSKIFLNKTLVKYFDKNGDLIPSRTHYEDITSYTPTWDTEEAPVLNWSFATDINGNPRIPEGSQATLDPVTGTLSDIDMEGEYVIMYSMPDETHHNCMETVTYIVDHRATSDAEDDEIRNIIGNGFILQNFEGEDERYALSMDTHGVTDGELLQIADAIKNPQNVLDGRFSTYATAQQGISVAQNNIILGVRAMNDETFGTDDGSGHLLNPVRVGFIVEEHSDLLGLNALNFMEMRIFDQQGEADPVYRSLIEENTTVGADLIGQKQVVKKRYSILVPAGTKMFNEFTLWNCGVANLDLKEMRMYGTFVEEVDIENQNYNWAVGDRHDLIFKDATAVPMNIAVVDAAAGVLKNLDFMVDNDLNTAFEMGDGLGVGAGQIFRIELGRVVSPNEKIGIIMGNALSTVDLTAGNWMTVRLYPPVKTPAANAPRKVVSSNTPHTSVNEWNVLGAEVAGYGDRKGLYLSPNAPTSAMELELGDIAKAGTNNSIYGITVAPRADTNVRYETNIPTEIENVQANNSNCTITVDESGVAVVVATNDIKGVHLFTVDGKQLPCHAGVAGNRAEIQLGEGVTLIQMTMVDGSAQVFKVAK